MTESDIPQTIQQLMIRVLPRITEITCENTYEGEGDARRLVGQRITLYVNPETGVA